MKRKINKKYSIKNKERIVLGIDKHGKIIYLKENNNPPLIGVVGRQKMGMSYVMHSFMDKMYEKGRKTFLLNDRCNEFEGWDMPRKRKKNASKV